MKKENDHTRQLRERKQNQDADALLVRRLREQELMPPERPRPYFSEPIAYLLILEFEPGWFDVAKVDVRGWSGQLALCFASRLDALIEGAYRAKPGLRCHAVEARSWGTRHFRTMDGSMAVAFHLSWVGQADRLLLRADGTPYSHWRVLHEPAGPNGSDPAAFGVDAQAQAALERMHERAGLYSWQESNEQDQSAQHMDGQSNKVATAVRSMRTITRHTLPPDSEELAHILFDPDFEQWHFVRKSVTDDRPVKTWQS